MRLTDIRLKSIKTNSKTQKLFDGEGLYIEVSPKGSKLWRLKYRYAGKEKLLSLGSYPLISLKEAREKRDNARKLLDQNIDPSIAKKEAKQKAFKESSETFEDIAIEWHDYMKDRWSEGYSRTILKRIKADILPALGKLPIKLITPVILLNALKKIESRGVFETTKRARQYCSQIFRYAVATGRAERDVSVDIIGAFKHARVQHHATIEIEELPDFLHKLHTNQARLFPQTRLAIELMLLTFVRTNELLEATWEEIDFKERIWKIPAERMKMRKAHIVPLSNRTMGILIELYSMNNQWKWVLPSQTSPRKPMSNNTILYALYRMGYKGKATGHGFRALAMTAIKEKLGYRHEVVDRQLAHAHRNSVDAAYDRAQFLDEREIMMQDWADYISKLRLG